MNKLEKQSRIEFLEGQVIYHNEQYFGGHPEISDTEYDMLVLELQGLNPDSDILAEVGHAVTYGKTVKHDVIMGSLKKSYSVDEIVSWLKSVGVPEDIDLVVALKIDGLALRLVYEDGKLIQAATRGNGSVGQDVTSNIRATASIPNFIEGFTGEIRGEVYMLDSVFENLVANGCDLSNSRSAAAGSLNQQDPNVTASRSLSFYAYDIKSDDLDFSTEIDKARYFADKIPMDYVTLVPIKIGKMQNLINLTEKKRPQLPHRIDGLVISINNLEISEELGMSGKCPNGKISFKFKAEQKETVLKDITWQVGRTGKITPVAVLETVILDGSKVTCPTLHNISMIRSKGIHIGCSVLVEKAGDIIPQVVRVTKPADPLPEDEFQRIKYPTHCPSCGMATEEDDTMVRCTSPTCPAQIEEKMLNYIRALDIKGVGAQTISSLHKEEILLEVGDFYRLDLNDVAEVTGGESSASKIIDAIQGKKDIPLSQFLQSLGIEGMGQTTSKMLAKELKTLEAIRSASVEDFNALDGIGEVSSHVFRCSLKELHSTIEDLLKYISVEDVKEIDGPLKGQSFCITGSLPSGRKKKEIYTTVESLGGEVFSSVKKGLTYLIQADPTSESAKSKKAVKLGVKIISEEELENILS